MSPSPWRDTFCAAAWRNARVLLRLPHSVDAQSPQLHSTTDSTAPPTLAACSGPASVSPRASTGANITASGCGRNPVPVHTDPQPERHFDPCQRAFVDVFGFQDVHLGLVLRVLVNDEAQITFVARRAGRNVKVLLHG